MAGAALLITTGFWTCGASAMREGSKRGEARSCTTRGRGAGSSRAISSSIRFTSISCSSMISGAR